MYKNILIAIDISDTDSWKKALPTAIEFCRAYGATLRVMTVLPDFGMPIVSQFFPKDFEDDAVAGAEAELKAFQKEHVPDDIESAVALGHGPIPDEILRVQKEAGCDLIIMQARHPGMGDLMVKPNATAVTRHADCSVLVVRN